MKINWGMVFAFCFTVSILIACLIVIYIANDINNAKLFIIGCLFGVSTIIGYLMVVNDKERRNEI